MGAIFWSDRIEDNYIGHIMAEVYKDRVYEPFLGGKKGLTILDIGGNIGITSLYFSQFADKVYTVEPSKDHFANLTKLVEYNKLTNVTPINAAIYMTDGELDLFHNQNKTMFSLHTAVADRSLPSEKVRAITLATLFKENNIEHVDFMKLDVEGSEQEILGGVAFGEVASKIDSMLIESHSWSGRHPNQLKEALKNRNFICEVIPNDASLIFAHK